MNQETLMKLTEHLPMKIIFRGDGQLYLERYYIQTDIYGCQHWLHRFVNPDSDERPHNHPFKATSHILCGWYREHYVTPSGTEIEVVRRAGSINQIFPETIHRISDVQQNTWTYFVVEPGREEFWSFIDKDGNKTTEKPSETDWFLNYKTRSETYKELRIE